LKTNQNSGSCYWTRSSSWKRIRRYSSQRYVDPNLFLFIYILTEDNLQVSIDNTRTLSLWQSPFRLSFVEKVQSKYIWKFQTFYSTSWIFLGYGNTNSNTEKKWEWESITHFVFSLWNIAIIALLQRMIKRFVTKCSTLTL
jgi:hypothetical protein